MAVTTHQWLMFAGRGAGRTYAARIAAAYVRARGWADWQRYIDLFGMPRLGIGMPVREVPSTRYWRRRAARRSKRRILVVAADAARTAEGGS